MPPPLPPSPQPSPQLQYQPPTPKPSLDSIGQMARASWVCVAIAWGLSILTAQMRKDVFTNGLLALVQFGMILGGVIFAIIALARRKSSTHPHVVRESVVGLALGGGTILLIVAVLVAAIATAP